MHCLLLAAWLALAPPCAAQSEGLAEVEKAIAAEVERQKVVGLSAAVVADRKLVWSKGFGAADLEHSAAARPATVYRLASISKPITAVAVMQLVERGKLDLDRPVETYVPSWPKKEWPITARQLLAHLGGIRHYKAAAEVTSTRHFDSLAQALELFKDDPLLHPPGTKFAYSSYGYNLLGSVVEGASGTKFPDYCRENIFQPAGMVRTGPDDVARVIPDRARGYRRDRSGEVHNSALIDTSNKIPGGGFVSSAEDLARFAIALQGGTLLKPETLQRMFAVQKSADGKPVGYGLGWFVNGEVVRHGGSQPGTRTLLHMVPGRNFAVALLSNTEETELDDLARRIAGMVIKP